LSHSAPVRYLGLGLHGGKIGTFLVGIAREVAKQWPILGALPLTHKEIAEMIGSSRETVTRVFARFKREHLVKVDGSALIITNRPGLEDLLVG
jgi:CRP/FNR family transcriptional regulator